MLLKSIQNIIIVIVISDISEGMRAYDEMEKENRRVENVAGKKIKRDFE